jgi:hypothetical protein
MPETASGRPAWEPSSQPRPVADIRQLALGAGNITQTAAYRRANLPPYNSR